MITALPGTLPVLVVEDSDEDFETVLDALELAGITNKVHRVTTGDACLSLLFGREHAPLRIAVLLLDLNTPGMDGREALAAIRGESRLRALTVVVLSASASTRDIAECYAAGANAYHVKPVRYADHLHVLQELLGYWLTSAVLADPSGLQP